MATDTFEEFVKQRVAEAEASSKAVNWERKLADWLKELDALYHAMEEYLNSYVASGDVKVERRPIQLTEDYLGTYDAEMLAFSIGSDEILVKPIGTLLISSRGRVDLSGPRKTLRIVLLDEGGPAIRITVSGTEGPLEASSRSPFRGNVDHSGWYFTTQPPEPTVTAFDKDSFKDAVMEVAGA